MGNENQIADMLAKHFEQRVCEYSLAINMYKYDYYMNHLNIPVFHLFRFLKVSCFLWSTIWLAINQLQLSTAFKCDCPVLSDLPSLSGRLGPSLSHIAAPPNCQSSERAFCALTKALSVSL